MIITKEKRFEVLTMPNKRCKNEKENEYFHGRKRIIGGQLKSRGRS